MYNHDSFNVVGKIAHFFAENKALSLLVVVSVFTFGALSFVLMPKQYNPEIVRPAFAIQLQYAGATADEAVERVVYELVEKVSGVPGVDEIITEVHDGARVQSTVIFEVGWDTTKAKVDLMTRLKDHSYLAQGFISQPSVTEINPETIPVLQVAFSSHDLSISEVRNLVHDVSRELSTIEAVSDASVVGGYSSTLVLEIDPHALSRAQVSVSQVKSILGQSGVRVLSDGFENDAYASTVVFDGRMYTPDDVGSLMIGNGVYMRDVAKIYRGATPSRSYVLHDTKESDPTEIVMLSVSKVEGSSAPSVTKEVLAKIDTILAKDHFSALSYTVISDDGAVATAEIMGLTTNLFQSMAIVGVVLMLFLSARAASIVLIAIPSTLLIVFGIGFLFDQTINRITLFALILSLGLLVDASIVTVENMYVHLKRNKDGLFNATREIVIAGSINEIGIGLFLSTVTSVLVFIPVRYITGMMGPYMGPIAFFMPVALIVSMFVAIIIVPYMATHFLIEHEKPSKIATFIDRYIQKLIFLYVSFMQRMVDNVALQKKIIFGTIAFFLITLLFPLTGLEHFQMLPRADRNQFYVYIDAPVDTAVSSTRAITEEISELISEDDDVVSMQQFIATPPIVDFNGMFKGAQLRCEKYQSTIRVNLTDASSRDRSSTDIVTDLRKKLGEYNTEYALMTRFIEEPPGPPVRATLVAKVLHNDKKTFEDIPLLASLITKTDGVVDAYVSVDEPVADTVYTFDRDKASRLGVSEYAIRDVLSLYGDGVPVGEFMTSDAEFTPIMMTLGYDNKNEPSDITALSVQKNDGAFVPITSVLSETYEERESTTYLEREGKLTYITAEVEGRPIIYVVLDIIKQLYTGALSEYGVTDVGFFGLTLTHNDGHLVEIVWGGEWEMTVENFRDLGVAMAVALLLVYATLVAQYQSFTKPALLMVTIPLGLAGILTGFLFLDTVFGIYLTATALIGFIALIGIVVNNAIIFSEYLDQEMRGGTPFKEAIVQAGAARFRPIVLTSLTTILGGLTIASDPVWSGLSWAIVFGLSLSTVLTLIVYPTLLVFIQSNKK